MNYINMPVSVLITGVEELLMLANNALANGYKITSIPVKRAQRAAMVLADWAQGEGVA